MNSTGLARFPSCRGDRSGSCARVAGAHLAFLGNNPADAGAGLVCGTGPAGQMAFLLEPSLKPGSDGVNYAGGGPVGPSLRRVAGNAAILAIYI